MQLWLWRRLLRAKTARLTLTIALPIPVLTTMHPVWMESTDICVSVRLDGENSCKEKKKLRVFIAWNVLQDWWVLSRAVTGSVPLQSLQKRRSMWSNTRIGWHFLQVRGFFYGKYFTKVCGDQGWSKWARGPGQIMIAGPISRECFFAFGFIQDWRNKTFSRTLCHFSRLSVCGLVLHRTCRYYLSPVSSVH